MSMWTDLLLAHGFAATPRALAALTQPPRAGGDTTARAVRTASRCVTSK